MNYERANHRWDEARDAQLTDLWAAEVKVADIAVRMFTTAGAVADRRHLLGLPKRKNPSTGWTDERVEATKTLWRDGKSASQIAMILNCGLSRNAVIGKLHRMGLSHEGRGAPQRPTRAHYAHLPTTPRRKPKPAPIPGVSATLSWKSPVSSAEDQRARQAEGAAAETRSARGVNVDSPNARPFMEAQGGCKWALGDRGAIRYCCNPLAGGEGWGRVWCAGHVAVGLADTQPKGLKPRDATRFTRFEANDRYPVARPSSPVSAWDDAREAA